MTWRRLAIAAALTAAAAIAAAFALRAEIAERLLRHQLQGTALAGASYRVAEAGLARTVIEDIRLAGGSVERAVLAYRPAALLRGRIDSLAVTGARLSLAHIPWRAPPPAALPFSTLRIDDLQASFASPWGPATLHLEASLRTDGPALTGGGRWRLQGEIATAAGGLELSPVETAAGETALRTAFAVEEGALNHPRLRAGPLAGRLLLDWLPGETAPAVLGARLATPAASWDGRALGPAAAEASWTGRRLEGELAFGSGGGPFTARLALAARHDGRWLVEAAGEGRSGEDVEIAGVAVTAPAALAFAASGPLAALAEGELSALAATARLKAARLARGEALAADEATLEAVIGQAGGDGQASLQLRAECARLAAGGAVFEAAAIDLPLSLADEGARAAPGAFLRAGRLALDGPGLTLDGLLAELPLAIERDGKRLYLRLTDTAWLDVDRLAHRHLQTLEPLSLAVVEEHLPLLAVEKLAGAWSWDMRLKTGALPAAFALLEDGGARARVAGLLPQTTWRLGSLGLNHLQGSMEARGGDLAVAGPDLRIGDLRILASYNNGLSPWPQVEATVGTLEDLRRPARFAPASADAALRPAWPRGEDLNMEANLHMRARRYLANAEASWRAADGRLRALLRVPATIFEAGGIQPADLSPLYGALIDEAAGGFELRGELLRQDGSWRQAWRLLLDLSARAGGLAVEGLAGEIALSAIAPPATPPGQQLRARRLVLGGLALADVEARMALPGDGSLELEEAGAGFAGGRLTLAAAALDPGRARNALTLEAEGIELARLLERLPVAGLEGRGRIGGRLPLAFSPAGVAIEGGRLAAESGGRLRYAPAGPAGTRPAPLADFRFTALALAIRRPPGGPAAVALELAGANPAFNGGAPMRLDLRAGAGFEDAIREALAAGAVPSGW